MLFCCRSRSTAGSRDTSSARGRPGNEQPTFDSGAFQCHVSARAAAFSSLFTPDDNCNKDKNEAAIKLIKLLIPAEEEDAVMNAIEAEE